MIEFARNVLGYKDANSAEMRPTPQPLPVMEGSSYQEPVNVIDLMEEQKNITQMGGTMRLGAYDCQLKEGSKVFEAYTQSKLSAPLSHREGQGEGLLISERHRHRYEFNKEIVEIPDKRWYIGTQFHPEYSSTVLHPHPLFMSFIKECVR